MRCDAEVGKPGKRRGCRSDDAVVTIVTNIGSVLHYCEKHADHVEDPERRYHGPVVSTSWHRPVYVAVEDSHLRTFIKELGYGFVARVERRGDQLIVHPQNKGCDRPLAELEEIARSIGL